MTTKRIIILVVIVLLAVSAVFGVRYYLSFHTITVSLSKDVTAATVYQSGSDSNAPRKTQQVHNTKNTIRLRTGDYYIQPSGDKIDTAQINFIVSEDIVVSVNPVYSASYLQRVLKGEQNTLNTVISDAYPALIRQYTFSSGQLYITGDWYAATLFETPEVASDVSDTYRVILHRENNTWKIIVKPQLVIYAKDYPQIPHSVISAANQLPLVN